MKVMIVKELMTGDVSPVAMFFDFDLYRHLEIRKRQSAVMHYIAMDLLPKD